MLLAVHDGARYLEEALRSVMAQSLDDIEIVAVDDASTDATPAILARLAAEDPRLRVLRTGDNLGLPGALNLGLQHARAPYIARMDDDDVSLPGRLAAQKRFLDAHPGIDLVGTSIEEIDADGAPIGTGVQEKTSFAIRWHARFALPLTHPTFMFRARLADGSRPRYDPRWPLSQDHDFVCRLLLAGGQAVCLPQVLLRYRRHDAAVSQRRAAEQRSASREICEAFQAVELPGEVVAALAPLRACYFDGAAADEARMAGVFEGARAMLAHDRARHPGDAAWLSRQTTQLISRVLRRAGASRMAIGSGFLRHAPDLLPASVLRAMETRHLLPATMRARAPLGEALPAAS